MSKMNFNGKKETAEKNECQNNEEATNLQQEQENAAEECAQTDNVTEELDELKKKYNELNDSHLRLMAEFDNYRKRTLREKADLIKNGGEAALKNLLPVVDDFERALQNIRNSDDVEAIEAVGQPFDTEMFEAVATIPAPEPGMKGKILDCVQTGYTLNDRVLRHAKVVVGE
jgi:molecular chaperone GrpE